MLKALPITLPCVLLLSACGGTIHVAPALPICPEPITLPRSMTDPLPLPTWFPAPKPTTISLSQPPGEPPKCTPMPKR